MSNLTNLLSLQTFSRIGGQSAYLRVAWLPALVAVLATVVSIAVLHPGVLRGRYVVPAPPRPRDEASVVVAGCVCLALAPLFAIGVTPAVPAVVAAVVLVVLLAVRDSAASRDLSVPWKLALGVLALFVLVQLARDHGLDDLSAHRAGTGDGTVDHLRLAAVGAGAANLVNNLPAYLALRPTATDTAQRAITLLIGVNAGSIVLPWGSLATLLWRDRCARAGLRINTIRYVGESAVVAAVTVLSATLAVR